MGKKKKKFSEETIKSLYDLGEVLSKIHNRLLSEGYTYKDSQFLPPKAPKKPKSKD